MLNISRKKQKKIWIDLDNSPHVPFFRPIIKELNGRGFQVTVTARDCFQVCGLADLLGLQYKKIGRHYGKNIILKIFGTLFRSLQLFPTAVYEKPSLSLSHGSRSQLITASLLKIPTVIIFDYEYTTGLNFIAPDWTITPEFVSNKTEKGFKKGTLKYPGLKEDVYVADFEPNQEVQKKLGLRENDIVATIRPPATEAHYHNPEGTKLFIAVLDFLVTIEDIRIVILPRNEIKQTRFVMKRWKQWCDLGKIIIPQFVVNGLDLIWYSDFVVSGGGTMNREAAALGVPVYSIFRGKTGAVDKYLADSGRLTLISSVEEVEENIKITKRLRPDNPEFGKRKALKEIIKSIEKIFENI